MNITVFLGSRLPENILYRNAAETLGQMIAEKGHTLVYGGAKVGTMGVLADSCLAKSGKVIGIMPNVLSEKEIIHQGLTETIIVKDMHERKALLQDKGDLFIALPGGCGTMEEIFEVITWNQIGVHNKPYAFLNIDHFYDGIKTYLDNAYRLNFISKENYEKILFFDNVEELFKTLSL